MPCVLSYDRIERFLAVYIKWGSSEKHCGPFVAVINAVYCTPKLQ